MCWILGDSGFSVTVDKKVCKVCNGWGKEAYPLKKVDHVERVLHTLIVTSPQGVTASDIAKELNLARSTASRYLNQLVKMARARKVETWPVRYLPPARNQVPETNKNRSSSAPIEYHAHDLHSVSPLIVGEEQSLRPVIERALPALLYPPNGLPILLTGETGVGKSFLAEALYQVAVEHRQLDHDTPYITFNCAEYAENPELLTAQLFGVKKGAYTGAMSDRIGLVERADGGVLFLDEIHRLNPHGQEMLYYLIDKGIFRRLGETAMERKARVTLIAATTESPENALLPALHRRFAVKLTLPPLRERSQREREALLDHFLQQEAHKMGVPLRLLPKCRQLFLTYDCPGNVGQLKSDIQIACAHAFLRHIKSGESHVILTENDVSHLQANDSVSKESALDVKHTPMNRESASQPVVPGKKGFARVPNVYVQLMETKAGLVAQGATEEHIAQSLEEVVDQYILTLIKTTRQQEDVFSGKTWLIGEELLQTLRQTAVQLHDLLPAPLTVYQLMAIGLHIQSFLQRASTLPDQGHLPEPRPTAPVYRQAAQQLASAIQNAFGVTLPEQEIGLLARLLSPVDRPASVSERVAVLVVTHGEAAAKSMAKVTNALLGTDVIHAIDMPLNQPTEIAYQRILEKIQHIDMGAGVLMLVDIGSLISMGEALSQELNKPIETVSHVNLPMVLEAGRKALLPENDLEAVKHAAVTVIQSTFSAFHDSETKEQGDRYTGTAAPRLIATVCLTGEGAAVSLEHWLTENLPEEDKDVVIRSVRIDPKSRHSPLLQRLQQKYQLVAVIGTVAPDLDTIPFIPVWELLQPFGMTRLTKLLEGTRDVVKKGQEKPVELTEIPVLVETGLSETVEHYNPRRFCQILSDAIVPLRRHFLWAVEQELGIWMHLGVLTDRLLRHQITDEGREELQFEEVLPDIPVLEKEQALWESALSPLETQFHLRYPLQAVRHLVRLSK